MLGTQAVAGHKQRQKTLVYSLTHVHFGFVVALQHDVLARGGLLGSLHSGDAAPVVQVDVWRM